MTGSLLQFFIYFVLTNAMYRTFLSTYYLVKGLKAKDCVSEVPINYRTLQLRWILWYLWLDKGLGTLHRWQIVLMTCGKNSRLRIIIITGGENKKWKFTNRTPNKCL